MAGSAGCLCPAVANDQIKQSTANGLSVRAEESFLHTYGPNACTNSIVSKVFSLIC